MPALLEKPQISRAMWDALKTHIMKERQKKKQEQEQDAAIERMRKERENKQKQDVMTLEETKEQISQLEQKLEQFREEKHQLFLQLKKVLNEDETRRKARENDMISVNHYQTSIPMGGHPNMFMQAGPMTSRSPMYKVVQQPPQQNLIPVASLKRSRSPSPPPSSYPQPPYNYKVQSMPVYNQKHNQYPGPQSGHYYSHSAAAPPTHSTSAPTYTTGSQPVYNYAGHGQYPPGGAASSASRSPQAQPQQSPTEQPPPKHVVPHGYHIQHVQQGAYMGPNHQSIDHPSKQTFPEEKYYAPSNVQIRGMNSIHHSQTMIPIQQQQPKGSITTGYPIRTQPPPPPPTLSSPYPPVPTSTQQQHNSYNPQPGTARIGYTNQPPPGRYY